jgi:hypothetical protein
MKITKPQIQDLYKFTRQHFVEHYDVQTELVDHLANDIEQIWLEYPDLSYEEAKQKSFKKFGVFGFMDVVEQKQKSVGKRYRKYLWSEFKKWIEIPQIFLTLLLFFVFYFSFTSAYSTYLPGLFYAVLLVWSIYKSIRLSKQFKRRMKRFQKKWLLEEMIFKQASITTIFFGSQFFNVFHLDEVNFANIYRVFFVSLLYTVLFIISYISYTLIPKKAEILLEETYSEYKIV